MYYSEILDSTKNNLSRNIFLIRKGLDINHENLCALTGLTRPILSSIENSSGNPTIETLIKISTALNISVEMLFMSKLKFNELKLLLKSSYEINKQNEIGFLIPGQYWKLLLKNSGSEDKNTQAKIAKICYEILRLNYDVEADEFNNMLLGAILGVVYQNDGFENGLRFGTWLGDKLK
jgi:transcriptional regulator with XRE-family HTH domain